MQQLSLIGYGEAARTFATAARWEGPVRVFDIKTRHPETRYPKLSQYRALRLRGCETSIAAVRHSQLILSLVTADQAASAGLEAARAIDEGALYCDMNSVAPGTKRLAEAAIDAAGGRYVDVAIMAPVSPLALAAPLLVSGPHAEAARKALGAAGFSNIAIAGARTGDASAVKMIRSVIVKGIEALTAEAMIAAARAGVADAVLASLGEDWPGRADYNLERMLNHGLRRAAEMEEVAMTLDDLGVEPHMTRGTIARQEALGALNIGAPDSLAAKLDAIREKAA